MVELLSGLGLSASAGLNAAIPLLLLGLAGRFTDLVTLPATWRWLEDPVVLAVLGALLAVEVVADKVPMVDHLNDAVQTLIRPTSGGLAFGATAGETTMVTDPREFLASGAWRPVVTGLVIALVVHLSKAGFRAAVNVSTAGFGAPLVSTAEDLVAVSLSLAAILVPLLVVAVIPLLVIGPLIAFRARRRRRRALA